MTQELLGRVYRELLDVLKSINQDEIHHDGDDFHELLSDVKEALAQTQEPVEFAGIKMWVGNYQVVRLLTKTELHHAIDPWLLVELNAKMCIKKLKEKNT